MEFGVYEVTECFSPRALFSDIDLEIAMRGRLQLESLVHFNCEILTKANSDEADVAAVEMLLPLLTTRVKLHVDSDSLENVVMRELIKSVLHPLSTETIMEKKYRTWIEDEFPHRPRSLLTGFLGMGSKDTWHGQPDARIRGSSPVLEVDVVGFDDEDEAETDAATTPVEGKRKAKKLSQSIATTVVSSFTEKKLHPSENALVPSILINCRYVRVLLYDCQKDVLLISAPVDLVNNRQHVIKSTILFLWLFINHRYIIINYDIKAKSLLSFFMCNSRLFLGTIGDNLPQSSIHKRLEYDKRLNSFRSLREKCINWNPGRGVYADSSDAPLLTAATGPPPSKKKRIK